MTTPLLTDQTLDTVRSHARSAAYHRTMRQRWSAIRMHPASLRAAQVDPSREARRHEVSAAIADTRLKYALVDARQEDIDPGLIQIAVMEGEAAGVDDADRELPFDLSLGHRYVVDKQPGSSTYGFRFLADAA